MTTPKQSNGGGPTERRHNEEKPDRRSPFERDRDRILYSSAFRRLAGVAQIAAVREHHLLHNRLTHSLKVAQVGRRIAQRLGSDGNFTAGLDDHRDSFPDVVEAAGLAHDIGHPPFGHTAEGVLADKMAPFGGFEGNAQSFRVVTKLAVHSNVNLGLDLTRATLNAILKYPRYEDEASWVSLSTPWHDRLRGLKWGAYRSEQEDFEYARKGSTAGHRSAGAILMDWADDVSYVTHDLHDYFRARLMPLHALRHEPPEEFFKFAADRRSKYKQFDDAKFREQYHFLAELMPLGKWRDTRHDRVDLDKLMRKLIGGFFDAVQTDGATGITIDEEAEYRVEVLKQLTFFYVIRQPGLALVQEGQKAIIGRLFDDLMSILARHRNGKKNVDFPVPHLLDDLYDGMERHEVDSGFCRTHEGRRARAVCDYICALTEDQAINLYERITGQSVSQGSMFGVWFG
ncbi:deoxyguanosinetriphosphate triphosphohydrolase family protein [Streptomyces gardneri]|uniref:deoxyguanosinetriphosphate triphosphohydrolase family protein n=1 Tax=Streptomyces gardneri TaxID=66892 RepID=UPI0035D8B716